MKKKILSNKVLIVDDELIIALGVQLTLKNLGFKNVWIANSGEEAITLAKKLKPELIIMDIRLGNGINGYEAAEKIQNEIDSNVLFLSGYPDINLISQIVLNCPNSLILKPLDVEELKDKINLSFKRNKTKYENKFKDCN